MSISVICPNGHRITAKETLAGKSVRCPKCKAVIEIPLPDEPEVLADFETLEEWDPLNDGAQSDGGSSLFDLDAFADPLGNPAEFQPLQSTAPLAASAYSQPFASSSSPATKVERSRPESGSNAATTTIWAAAGSGLLVGLLFTGLSGWLLLSGRSDSQVVASAATPLSPTSSVATDSPLVRTEVEGAAEPAAAEPPPAAASAPEVKTVAAAANEPGLSFGSLQAAASPLDLAEVKSDDRLEVYKLPGKTWAADYDRASGRFAVTNDDLGVIVYDIDETARGRAGPVGAIPLEGLPTAVCFKTAGRRLFLVAAANERSEVQLFDAESFKPVGEVPIPTAKFLDYLCGHPSPDDPHVYYSTQRYDQDVSRRFKPDQLGRIDVTSMKVAALNTLQPKHGGPQEIEAASIQFSDQGELLYVRSPAGSFSCLSLERDNGGMDTLKLQGGTNPQASCAVGTNDQLVASGPTVMNRCFSVYQGSAEFDVEAFFPSRPLMLGFTENAFACGSTNDFRTVATIPLPSECVPSPGFRDDFRKLTRHRPKFTADFHKVFIDEDRGLAMAVLSEHVVVVPLARLQLPTEKSITVTQRLPTKLLVNEKVTLELQVEADDVTFEIGDGRAANRNHVYKEALGADGFDENLPVISHRTLTWTPTPAQLGRKWIHLRTKQGKLTRDWSWVVDVEQKKSAIPFYVTGVNIEFSGKLAVVWGRSHATASEQKFYLGLLDVERGELLQQTEVPKLVESATLDDSGVYVCNGLQLMRLDRKTLDVQQRVEFGSAAELQVVGGKYLAATGRRGSFDRFNIPDLTPAEPPVNSYEFIPLGGRLNDQSMWDGIVWDTEMKTPELLAFPARFGISPERLGVGIIGGGPGLFGYQVPDRYAGPCNTETPTFATACTLFGYSGFAYVQNGRLNAHAPILHLNGQRPEKPVKSVALSTFGKGKDASTYLSSSREVIGVASGGELTLIPAAEIVPSTSSFRIARKQSTFVLETAATTVRYEANDATKFRLFLWPQQPDPSFYEEPQLTAESQDGSFTLTLEPDKLSEHASQFLQKAQFPDGRLKSIDDYLEKVGPVFETLVGRKPEGVPFPIFAAVVAESSYQETDTLVHYFLVEVPRTSVEGKVQ